MTIYVRDTCFNVVAKYDNIKLITFKGLKLYFIKEDGNKIYFPRPHLYDIVVKNN